MASEIGGAGRVGPGGWAWRAALAVLLALPGGAQAGELYFVIVFATQGDFLPLPRYAHTFATFVKATGEGPWPDRYAVEAHTISWCPASGDVRVARLGPERGVNLDLSATLRWARSLGAGASRWGPFQVRKELYDRARAQIARLESGAVWYKTIDGGPAPHQVSNCIHAVSDIDADGGPLDTGLAFGDEASYLVARHLARWMIDPCRTHEWVYDRLGLRGLPIRAHTWARPP
jgi:hypothetical protein